MKKEGRNFVRIIGEVGNTPWYSHTAYEEDFYKFKVISKRLSGVEDVLSVVLSDRMFDLNRLQIGKRIYIEGELRSYNEHTNDKTKLILDIFANEIYECDEVKDLDLIELTGYVCKPPVLRETPLGRKISDIILAVNRTNGKSDYIPVVAWGRIANYISKHKVGDFISVNGRIQSREYMKDGIKMTAYEVSIVSYEQVN